MTAVRTLQGKVALITGASRGIGKSVAERFAAEGVRLAICARGEDDLRRTADELTSQSRADVLAVKANVARLNDIRRFVSCAEKKFGRIDLLVNNAGGPLAGGILSVDDAAWEEALQLKLLGYVRMAREVVPRMRAGGGGRIINVAGMTGREPDPRAMVPGMINAAILNFTKSLARELEPDRIAVAAVSPGPAGAEAVAEAILFLASDAGRSVNGSSINVDAGTSAGLW